MHFKCRQEVSENERFKFNWNSYSNSWSLPKFMDPKLTSSLRRWLRLMRLKRLEQQSPTFLAPGTGFVEDSFPTGWGRGGGSGGMVQAVMRAMGSGRWSIARSRLTSCCAARFLTGRRPVPVHGPGIGDPWARRWEAGLRDVCLRMVGEKEA